MIEESPEYVETSNQLKCYGETERLGKKKVSTDVKKPISPRRTWSVFSPLVDATFHLNDYITHLGTLDF